MNYPFLIVTAMLAPGLAACEKPLNKPVPVVAAPAPSNAPADAGTLAPPQPGEPIHTLPRVK